MNDWEKMLEEVRQQEVINQWLDAAERGDMATVKTWLDQGWDVNKSNGIGDTALMRAVRGQHLELIDFLLEQGADLSIVDSSGFTATTWALIRSKTWRKPWFHVPEPDPRLLERLLKAGGQFRLCEAVLLNDVELARVRLDEGEDVNFGTFTYLGPVLKIAAHLGHLEMVQFLLDRGADPNKTCDVDLTALHAAAEIGHVGIVTCLLDHGAKINHWGAGDTPLDWASQKQHQDVMSLLISRGAEPSLIYAVARNDEALVAQKLQAGADPNRDCCFFRRVALFAVNRGHPRIVRCFLEQGAVHCKKSGVADHVWLEDPHSLLAEAARMGHVEIIKILIEAGADLSEVGMDGLTPLQWAVREGQRAAVEALQAAGAAR